MIRKTTKNSQTVAQKYKIPILHVFESAKKSQTVVQKELFDTYKNHVEHAKVPKTAGLLHKFTRRHFGCC